MVTLKAGLVRGRQESQRLMTHLVLCAVFQLGGTTSGKSIDGSKASRNGAGEGGRGPAVVKQVAKRLREFLVEDTGQGMISRNMGISLQLGNDAVFERLFVTS